MDVVTSKVRAKVQGILDGEVREVLVFKNNNFSLSCQSRELRFACIVELRQLDS